MQGQQVDTATMVAVVVVVAAAVVVATVETATMTMQVANAVGVGLVNAVERGWYTLTSDAVFWEHPRQWMASFG